MERIKNYYEKNGFVYGASSEYAFGDWNHRIYRFESLESAFDWLNTEDFRERKLMSASAAKKLVGAKAWRNVLINFKKEELKWKAMSL